MAWAGAKRDGAQGSRGGTQRAAASRACCRPMLHTARGNAVTEHSLSTHSRAHTSRHAGILRNNACTVSTPAPCACRPPFICNHECNRTHTHAHAHAGRVPLRRQRPGSTGLPQRPCRARCGCGADGTCNTCGCTGYNTGGGPASVTSSSCCRWRRWRWRRRRTSGGGGAGDCSSGRGRPGHASGGGGAGGGARPPGPRPHAAGTACHLAVRQS